MASIKYIIAKRGGDRPEVILRLTIDSSLKVQSKVPGVLVYRQYWSEPKQCNDTSRKFIKPWEVQEMTAINKTLANLAAEILTRATATAEENITRSWLMAEIDNILHPDKNAPKKEAPKTLMQAVNDLIDGAPTRIVQHTGKPVNARTQIHYKQMRNHLTAFLNEHELADLDLADVNKEFYDNFVAFLYGQGLKLNTIGKHIKNIKAAINALPLAQRANCEFVEPKKCVKLAEEVDNIYLTENELEAIATLPIDTPYLDRVRDQFILLAWTGCRYSDLDKLTRDNIVTINGREYFKIEQQKTGARPTIPILPATRAILEKYGYNVPRPMANQKFNEYIKDVARLAGLTDEVKITRTEAGKRVTQRYVKWQCVSAHTARRSFATNMYKRDFPTLMIMKITGHQTEKAFLSYIKVTEDENAERMMKLFEEQEARRLEQGAGK